MWATTVEIKLHIFFPGKKENLGSCHQRLFKKNVGKTKRIRNGLRFEKKDLRVVYC